MGLLDVFDDEELEFPTTVSMRLRCAACGHIGRYKVDTIYIDAELYEKSEKPEDYTSFGSYFRCRKCKSAWPWEFTPDACLAITAMTIAKRVRIDDPRLEFACPRLYDGTPFRSAAQAEEHLLEALNRNPHDAHVWSRLGNVYRRADLLPKAKKAYKAALKIDPNHLESYYNLGAMLYDEAKHVESAKHLHKVLELASEPRKIPEEDLRGMVKSTLLMLSGITHATNGDTTSISDYKPKDGADADQARTIRLESFDLGRESEMERAIDLFVGKARTRTTVPKAMTLRGRKVGRNEPCPCGSGKKYKKCCGR